MSIWSKSFVLTAFSLRLIAIMVISYLALVSQVSPANASCAAGFGQDESTLVFEHVVVAKVVEVQSAAAQFAVTENWQGGSIGSKLNLKTGASTSSDSGDSEAAVLTVGESYLLGFADDGYVSICSSLPLSEVNADLRPEPLGEVLADVVSDYVDNEEVTDNRQLPFIALAVALFVALFIGIRRNYISRTKSSQL